MRNKHNAPAEHLNGEMLPAGIIERHIHEECGVFGVFSKTTADVASLAY